MRLGIACTALVAGALLSGPATGTVPSTAALDSALAIEARAGFSGVVLVAGADGSLFERACGRAAESGIPPERLAFWLASDSKQFTATAILRLADAGQLRVTDSLARFFPEAPPDKRAITLHQLLTHTSGLPTSYKAEGVRDRDQAVNAILGLKLETPPGTTYAYSNDGYNLLAAVVEIASSIPFDTYLRDSLFARAGLAHTGLWGHEDSTAIAPLADPRRAPRAVTIWRDGHSVANWGYRGSGGAYATAEDVLEWIRELRTGKVLRPASVGRLLGRHVLVRADSTLQTYAAYGWGVRVVGGRVDSYSHAGDDDALGHSSVIRFTPDGEVVVVLANSGESGNEGWASRVNRVVRRLEEGAAAGR